MIGTRLFYLPRNHLAMLAAFATLLAPVVAQAQTSVPSAVDESSAAALSGASNATVAPPLSAAGYAIGPEDVVEISLIGQADFKTRSKVRSDGTIQLPLLGTVNVSGRTPITLSEELAGKLRAGGYYAKPVVNVEIVSFASRYVVVLGDVAQPGLQAVERAYRVSEVIARAGGLRETGSDYVILRRASGGEVRLPYDKLARGSAEDDPFVQAGDKIYVPAAELFYIYGQINAPGAFPLRDGITLRKALARAGGISPTGSERKIKVFRGGVSQKLDLETTLKAGDVIVVGERLF